MPAGPGTTPTQQPTWTFANPYGPQQGAPLLVAGDRLIGFASGQVYAVNLFTGAEVTNPNGFPFAVQRANPQDTSPVPLTSSNGAVFFPAADQNGNAVLQALRLVDGTPLPAGAWAAPALGALMSITAVDQLVLLVQQDQNGNTLVSAVFATDGTTAWGPLTVTNLTSGAVGYGDHAIFFVAGRQLFAVNTDFGDTRFPRPDAGGGAPGNNINQQMTPLIGAGVAICAGDHVWGFDTKTGAELWSWQPGDSFNATATPAALSADGHLVAVVSDSNLLAVLDTRSGTVKWSQPVGYPGTPVIAGDRVFVSGAGQSAITSFDLASGTDATSHALDAQVGQNGVSIGNGHLFVQTGDDGRIAALPYQRQSAAWFDGKTSHVDIAADGAQFDFSARDFTIEAWIRSGEGGEILCGHPTVAGAGSAGFRFNVGDAGQLRFAVTDLAGVNQDLAQSLPTPATDGRWHHIAVVRRDGGYSFFIDGVASLPATLINRAGHAVHQNGYALDGRGRPRRDTLTPPPAPDPLRITGNNQLYVGWDFYGVAQRAPAPDHFAGLMREVRLWDKALDVTALQSRMNKVLAATGADANKGKANEPRLLGNWHLDDPYVAGQAVTIENDVEGHEFPATFHNAASSVTDLELDLSAFPYLLDQVEPQWPYTGFWSARGEHDLATPIALSPDGTVCFGTDNALYGVRRLDGARRWTCQTAGNSAPIAFGSAFYVNMDERGIVAINATTGAASEVEAFALLPKGAPFAAPAASGAYVAAAAPDGTVMVASPLSDKADFQFATAANPGDLQFDGNLVACVAGAGARRLFLCNIATRSVDSFDVGAELFRICGSRAFFIANDRLVCVDMAKPSSDPTYRYVASSVTGAQVTGLAALADSNVLAVATDGGTIYGLSLATLALRWSTSVPDGGATGPGTRRGYLNPPTIAGRTIYCGSRSGAVAAIDAPTGRLLNLLLEPNAIVTPVLSQAGTAFFGCAPAAPAAHLDGALHSVVFGETIALRTGVDLRGRSGPIGWADIASPKAIRVGQDGECCIEAWIKAWPGDANEPPTDGEIVSVRPCRDGNFGARLILGADRRIRFVGHDRKPDGNWEGFGTRTVDPATLRDGEWHHVAASRVGTSDIRLYVDGKAQSTEAAAPVPLAAADIADAFAVRIGAPAYQAEPDAGNAFRGLIGEVRLWETWLPADQISDRMHAKLRGDEFSLAAYWDFNACSVHDGARNGYDGAPAKAASFSLCDLTFDLPDYPDVATSAKLIQTGYDPVAGAPWTSKNDTVFELTIACTKADQSPLPNAKLTLWYVKHPGEQQPAQITLSSADAAPQDLLPVTIDEESAAQGFAVSTDDRGRAVVKVATRDRTHGPSLDLAADFMPANERFHVNVLIDEQSFAKPVAPSLVVQTKLTQDYYYSSGGKIDDTRTRDTYRTVITAVNGDGSPRAGEWIEISTADFPAVAVIEVDGRNYSINPHNSQAFQADANGQVTVVVDATGLKTADLLVWAGFMHQGDRVTIAMDQDSHDKLAGVKGDAMKDPDRLINWKPNGGSVRGPLLKGDYQDHADDIASGLRHIASAVKPSPAPAARATLRADKGGSCFLDMRQPVKPVYGDRGRALRTLKHVARRAPVAPQAVLASIQTASPGSVGFFFDFGDGSAGALSFGHFGTADAATHMGQPRVVGHAAHPMLGFSFGDAWHAVTHAVDTVVHTVVDAAEEAIEAAKHAAEVVAEAAERAAAAAAAEIKKIAVEVGNAVTVAIHYVDDVVHIVVNSIKDAMEVVGNFLAKIALMIVDMIKFLLFLFDWDAILATHAILRDTMLNSVAHLLDNGRLGEHVLTAIGDVMSKLPGGDAAKAVFDSAAAQVAAQDRVASAPGQQRDYSQANGVSGSMMYSKMKQYREQPSSAVVAGPAASLSIDAMEPKLMTLLDGMVGMSPSELGHTLLGMVESEIGDEARNTLVRCVNEANALLQPYNLQVPINVPFLSDLYYWLTKSHLTLLDLTCLVLAIPTNLVYGVISGLHHFNDDAKGLPDQITAAHPMVMARARARPMLLASAPSVDQPIPLSLPVECILGVVRIFYAIANAGADATFTATFGKAVNPARNKIQVIKSLLGLANTTLTQLAFVPTLNSWVGTDRTMARASMYTGLVVGALGDLLTLASAIKGSPPSADDWDEFEYKFCWVKDTLLIGKAIYSFVQAVELSKKSGVPPAAVGAYWLYQISTALSDFAGANNFLYTRTGADKENCNPETYASALRIRAGLIVASAVTIAGSIAVVALEDR